jgi:hypothetical protein
MQEMQEMQEMEFVQPLATERYVQLFPHQIQQQYHIWQNEQAPWLKQQVTSPMVEKRRAVLSLAHS